MNAPVSLEQPQVVKLTARDFLLLDDAGAFAAYGKTELIDGVIRAVNAQHRPYGYAKNELAYRLRRALEELGSDLFVWTEASVEAAIDSVPEPDIMLAPPDKRPGVVPATAAALVVEVSASTQRLDLGPKARIYARAGIPEYWVLDVEGSELHRFSQPGPDGYATREKPPLGELLTAATIPGLTVATDGLV